LLLRKTAQVTYYNHIDFNRVDEYDLLDFIENRQHAFTRKMLDLIILNLQSALRNNPSEQHILTQVVKSLESLRPKIEQLISLQETNLFPFLRKLLEVYKQKEPSRFLKIKLTESSIRQIKAEHAGILTMLESLRSLTNQFQPPAKTDEAMKLCYAELQEFSEDLTQQLYREDQFLLPRIATIEEMVLNRSQQDDALEYGHGGDA